MIRRLTLTARLTFLYTLVSASVLLGLGVLVAWSTHLHFVDLDRHYLQDKVQLIQKIVHETPDAAELTAKLDEMLDSHHGLFIAITRGNEQVFGPSRISFRLSAEGAFHPIPHQPCRVGCNVHLRHADHFCLASHLSNCAISFFCAAMICLAMAFISEDLPFLSSISAMFRACWW